MSTKLISLIVLTIIIGLTSGLLGAIWTENYLTQYKASLEEAGERQLTLSQEKPRPLPGTYEEALAHARETLQPALVRFYTAAPATILPNTESALGVAVTSDGWVLSTKGAIGSAAAYVGTTGYVIDQTLTDPLTEVVMIHLMASGLPVIPFGASSEVESGELAFAALGERAILSTSIVDARHFIALIASNPAEAFTTDFLYADGLDLPGTPVVNSAGELVAVGQTPLHQVLPIIKSVIRSGEVSRAKFGAALVDLSAVRLMGSLSRGFTRGAYVDAVPVGSPAAAAGLKRADIITRFGDVALNGHLTLAEILADYQPGQTVEIILDRAGEEMQIEVQLGQFGK